MNVIPFYLAYSFLWLITLLPLPVLYLISDLISFLIYHIVLYRRKTAMTNLRRSFPDKSTAEIRRIAKASYRQLTDYFLEWMYRIHMGEKELTGRMHYKNPEIFKPYLERGRDIMLYVSHYGNWEWLTRLGRISGYTLLGIYKPLQNKHFDRLFLKLRTRFGGVGVPMASTLRTLIEYQRTEKPALLYTLADQRPEWLSIQHWTRFLNQDTPVITGPEKIARKYKMVSILITVSRIKRGYYEAEFQVLCEDADMLPEFEITRRYLGAMENTIKNKPELYLWTHKRWKYHRHEAKNQVDIGPLLS